MQKFWALVKKEFFSYVNSPLAYVVIVPFLLVSTFLYFRTALLLGDANLRPFIELLPWFMIVIGPALAMRSLNEEQRNDTIELLFAHPLSEWTIVLAKFLGLLLFYIVFLGSTIALPLVLILFSQPDLGLMFGQYLGAILMGAVFLAVGMTASAYVSHVVGSFLVGTAVNFGLVILGLGFVTLMLPAPLNIIVTEASVVTRVSNLSRGVVDIRDLVYFVTLIGIILALAVFKLSERKLAENPKEKNKLYIVFGLIAAVGIAVNVLLFEYPIRADLTANQRYSLSTGTKSMLRELPDRVNITLYSSTNLPGQLQLTLRETSDRLKDFSRYSDRVSVNSVIVSDPASQQEAISKGIREVTFNQIGAGSFQVQTGVLGLEIRFADQSEVIDFIQDATDLEYQLSRMILSMTREDSPAIGLVNLSTTGQFQRFEQLLSDNYTLDWIDPTSNFDEGLSNLSGIIVIDTGESDVATASAAVNQYIQDGGNALLLVNGVIVEPQMLTVQGSESPLLRILSRWGVEVQPNLVYDIQLNESISLGGGGVQYIVPYPFWLRSLINSQAVPWTGSGSNVLLGWPSQVIIEQRDQAGVSSLLVTSPAAGIQSQSFTISPDQLNTLEPPLGEQLSLGALVDTGDQRLALVANTHWIADDFLANTAENESFASNLVDWVAADEVLSTIPKRTDGRNVFQFSSETQVQVVQWTVLLLPPLLVGIAGFTWLRRRRIMTRREYVFKDQTEA